jgi:hypothetical protein
MNEKNRQVVVFLDSVNRTIIAEKVGYGVATSRMRNPAIMSVSFDPKGKMQLQLIPVFFRELFKDKNYEAEFLYNDPQITMSNIVTPFYVNEKGEVISESGVENGIIQQYVKLFSAIPTEAPIKE